MCFSCHMMHGIVAWQASFPRELSLLSPAELSWLTVTFLGASSLSLSGPVSSDLMPNGDGLAEGYSAAGDACINGSLLPTAPPQNTSSPVNSHTQEPSPGVAAYPPMMLEKSEGASAGVTIHTSDALQSLRLSMPMQETELCKHKLIWSECPICPAISPCI